MKRFTLSLYAWALAAAGLLSTAGVAQAAIADYAGSYAANLASSETPPGGGDPVDVFYGRLEFTVNAKSGIATGTLQTRAGKSYSISPKFVDAGGKAVVADKANQNNVALVKIKGSSALAINFSLTINADGTVEAAGTNTASGDANGAFFVSRSYKFTKFTGKVGSQPAWKGTYTLALVAPEGAGSDVPAGAGYASLSVNTTGKLSFKGKLGDGTALTGSANPIDGAVYSLFVKPPGYLAGGYFVAELDLDQRGELATPALWKKPAKAADKAYPMGFSTEPIVVIQPWTVPAAKTYPLPTALGFSSSKNFSVDFSGEALIPGDVLTLPEIARVTGAGLVQAVSGGLGSPAENNSKAWNAFWKNVKIDPKTGVFSGKQVLRRTVGSKTSNIEADVGGVLSFESVLDVDPFAFGQYVVKTSSSTITGLVTFAGPLEDNTAVATAGTYTVLIDESTVSDVVTSVSGPITNPKTTITEINPPKRPAGSPADGKTVTFTISEDLQSMVFNGQKLTLKSSGLLGLVYHKVVVNPRIGVPNGQFAVTITVDQATGLVTNVGGFAQFITMTSLRGSTRTQNTVFGTQAPTASSIKKQG